MLICLSNKRWRSSFNSIGWPSGTVQAKKECIIKCATINYITYYLLVFLVFFSKPVIAFSSVQLVPSFDERMWKRKTQIKNMLLFTAWMTRKQLKTLVKKKNSRFWASRILWNLCNKIPNYDNLKDIKGSSQPYFRMIFAKIDDPLK